VIFLIASYSFPFPRQPRLRQEKGDNPAEQKVKL